MTPAPIPPEAYERLDALKAACERARAARSSGNTMALEDALVAAGIHWRALVRLHHPELTPCPSAESRSSGS